MSVFLELLLYTGLPVLNFHVFVVSDFSSIKFHIFEKKISVIRSEYQTVWTYLGPNCFQKLSADDDSGCF